MYLLLQLVTARSLFGMKSGALPAVKQVTDASTIIKVCEIFISKKSI
jgi:hypothetical protein